MFSNISCLSSSRDLFRTGNLLQNATWKCSWSHSDLLNKLLLCECIFFNTFSCRGDNSDWSKENWLKTILERNLEGVTNFIMSKVKIVNRGIWNYFLSEKDFLNSCLKKFRYFPRYFHPRRIHFKQQLLQCAVVRATALIPRRSFKFWIPFIPDFF